ncbi:helix-turn-helix transcriptional regulator [Bradyrhizobium elkanii]|uniref:Prophage regulatory protein n=1 Tax=Bradyrhizobium elkanii TaxID=29448 RepID=A0ABV4F174_BRAEL|nr:AlpA family phage regulatory protein [Bradyrhizobium elkanii]MCP1758205.1 prophage regulatory protein [Bradyrhizobium elkanii]MCP1983522.1 prophage regulatory protein [Bradyrhizobium elkanii]MCS3881498.1 prophage regulatory protein [Bradyrhizobium elkanii]MCS4219450.1 prophage regulatory protein [Bradyrhizobium elkanii]MCW2210529.1 prophage regulatory protein [Bradyrhizobium elkanii]
MAAPVLISYDRLKTKGISLSKVQLWKLEKRSAFPRRVRTSPGRYAWVEAEIDAYISAKIAERDAAMVAA